MIAIRPFAATMLALGVSGALSACATDAVSRAEHAEVLSSLRAIRAENARLEARLEKLEAQQLVAATRAAQVKTSTTQSAATTTTRTTTADALPPLAVVKLKPRREAAPRLPTAVEVTEPPASIGDQLEGGADGEGAAELADVQFDRGLEMMKTGNSATGVGQLEQFVVDWPRHPKADNALYFTGLALMSEQAFDQAAQRFERVISQYPAGDAVLDSMLKLAECRLKLNRPAEARATWQKIVSSFPGTSAATQAQARLTSP